MSQKPTQECQRADWTAHKAVCQPYAGKKSLAGESGMQNMVVNWVQRNYFFILQQLDRVTHLHHVPKRECLLILDFYAERGTAPALCTPVPIFEIGVTKDFIDGDRHSKLNWFFKGTNVYKTNLQTFRKSLRGHYPRVTSNHLLTIFRYPTGTSGVCNIEFGCAPGSSHSMFSDAALEAFSQAIRHDKDEPFPLNLRAGSTSFGTFAGEKVRHHCWKTKWRALPGRPSLFRNSKLKLTPVGSPETTVFAHLNEHIYDISCALFALIASVENPACVTHRLYN